MEARDLARLSGVDPLRRRGHAADAAALSLRTRNAYSGQVLAIGLRATWRAQAGVIDENDVSYWVGLAGGTADAWNSAAMALSSVDVPMARLALTRAMTIDPTWGRWVALRVMLGPPWEDDETLVQ